MKNLIRLTALALILCIMSILCIGCAEAEKVYFNSLDELDGKRIGVETGSIYDKAALTRWPNAKLFYQEGYPASIMALQQNKIDAFLTDEPLARQIISSASGLKIIKEPVASDEYGFAFQKNAAGKKLRDEFNAFIQTANDGELLSELDKIWFGTNEALKLVENAKTLPATNGTIRFATTLAVAPFNYLKDGAPAGLEVDLITRFCKEKGYGLEISSATFSALMAGLASGRYDAVASSVSITEERKKSINLSDPFYHGGIVAIALAPESDEVEVATARIGAMTGSVCESYALSHYKSAEYSSFSSNIDLMTALKSGKLDYAVCQEIDAVNYARSDGGYSIYQNDLESGAFSIAVAKDNDALLSKIDALIERYSEDGTLARMKENWIRPDGSGYVIDSVPELTQGETLTVALCSELAPVCFYNDGELVGHDVELARRIAYDLGCQVSFSDMQFSALIAAIQSGRADIAITGITPTEERAQEVDFSEPYYSDPIVLLKYQQENAPSKGFFEGIADSFYNNFILESRYELVLSGIGITLLLSVCSGLFGIATGFGLCLMRRSRYSLLTSIAMTVTRILQGTPMVVLLMILYYIVFNKTGLDGIAVSIIAFGLNFGAYTSEIMLSGINAVDSGQREAAVAMGFSSRNAFIKIIFPQAARHFLPVLKGEYISLVKMTSIVGYVAVQDLTKVSDIIRSRTYEAFFPLIVTAIIYFLISFGLSSLLRLIEIRIDPKHRPRTLRGVELK